MNEGDGLGDAVVLQQGCLDLAQLYAQTAQLDLEVRTTDVFESAVFARPTPPHEVSGPVHTLACSRDGICDEAIGSEIRTRNVAPGQLRAGQIQLTRDTDWDRM
ncbi:hypothetical protein MLGJGCBP_03109 [Rhodococcus sp. T7]|nr:hypothetical protein MLGJGCBP_03109 [Rhodococcus sp. T7]